MSFWGNNQQNVTGSFEIDGGEPIPANTVLKAIISEAAWIEWQGDRKIALTWTVVEGEYKNRKVFQKLDVLSTDESRRNRQLQMLAAIDANAGGNLMRLQGEPTDLDLAQNLTQKIMFIRVSVWEMDGRSGNWVNAVSSGQSAQPNPQIQAAAQQQAPAQPTQEWPQQNYGVPF